MQRNARTVSALLLGAGLLLAAAPGARASDACDLTFYGFSANGKKYVMQQECMGSRTATLRIGTLASGKTVRIARGSTPYSKAAVLRHAKVRRLRLQAAGSSPGWTVTVAKRGSRFTFALVKGRRRIRLGARTFKRAKAIVVGKAHWERKLRGVVLRVSVHRGVSGHAGTELVGFRVKGLAPAKRSR